jgi:hypothetical protein
VDYIDRLTIGATGKEPIGRVRKQANKAREGEV